MDHGPGDGGFCVIRGCEPRCGCDLAGADLRPYQVSQKQLPGTGRFPAWRRRRSQGSSGVQCCAGIRASNCRSSDGTQVLVMQCHASRRYCAGTQGCQIPKQHLFYISCRRTSTSQRHATALGKGPAASARAQVARLSTRIDVVGAPNSNPASNRVRA